MIDFVSFYFDYQAVYLSKILIVFKAFKTLFVKLFVDFLIFHRPIVLVEACTGFR